MYTPIEFFSFIRSFFHQKWHRIYVQHADAFIRLLMQQQYTFQHVSTTAITNDCFRVVHVWYHKLGSRWIIGRINEVILSMFEANVYLSDDTEM